MKSEKFNIAKFLPHVFLFNNLSEEEIFEIAKTCLVKRYKKGTIVFSQGAIADAFFIVINGKISIFRSSFSGDEQVIHIHNDGDIVAEAAIFDKVKYPATCRTLKDTSLLYVPRTNFIEILMANPSACLKIMGAYSKRLREFIATVEYLSLDDVKIRIIKYLSKHIGSSDQIPSIKLKITKKELAHMIGTVPETLSRNLRQLKEEGIISEKSGNIQILDMEKFKQLLNS